MSNIKMSRNSWTKLISICMSIFIYDDDDNWHR